MDTKEYKTLLDKSLQKLIEIYERGGNEPDDAKDAADAERLNACVQEVHDLADNFLWNTEVRAYADSQGFFNTPKKRASP